MKVKNELPKANRRPQQVRERVLHLQSSRRKSAINATAKDNGITLLSLNRKKQNARPLRKCSI